MNKKFLGEISFPTIPQSIFLLARLTLDKLLKNAEFQPFDAPPGIIFLKFFKSKINISILTNMFVIHSKIVRCQVKVLKFIEYSHFSIFKLILKIKTTRYGLVNYTIGKLRKRAF